MRLLLAALFVGAIVVSTSETLHTSVPKNEADRARFYQAYADVKTGWVEPRREDGQDCSVEPLKFECTRTQHPRLAYRHSRPHSACARLSRLGVKSIAFYGDSFLRHAFQATALFLSGNYRGGSEPENIDELALNLKVPAPHVKKWLYPDWKCDFDAAFEDALCRKFVPYEIKVCQGIAGVEPVTLTLRHSYRPSQRPNVAGISNFDALIWGIGNHPLETEQYKGDGKKKWSIHNATWLAEDVLKPTCRCEGFGRGSLAGGGESDTMKRDLEEMTGFAWGDNGPNKSACVPWARLGPNITSKIIWLQPHFRPAQGNLIQERRAPGYAYARDMPNVVREICGVRHVVNPYNFTRDLVIESAKKNWDGAEPLCGEGGLGLGCLDVYKAPKGQPLTAGVPNTIPTVESLRTPPYTDLQCVGNCFDMQRDSAHWGMGVDLVKAHLIINEIFVMKGEQPAEPAGARSATAAVEAEIKHDRSEVKQLLSKIEALESEVV